MSVQYTLNVVTQYAEYYVRSALTLQIFLFLLYSISVKNLALPSVPVLRPHLTQGKGFGDFNSSYLDTFGIRNRQ